MTTMTTATTGWARASAFTAHESLVDLIAGYARHRGVVARRVVDLWAPSGGLAEALSSRWPEAQVLGLYPDDDACESSVAATRTSRSVADASGPGPHLDPSPDVVVGVPPWHWAPRRLEWTVEPGVVAELAEDPANAALLEACTRLSRSGLGFFVVGPGFLMRPGATTAFAQFSRFGLHVDGAISLPRGSFTPDCGAGRVLLVVTRSPQERPIYGRLTGSVGAVDRLLAQVA